MTWYLTYRALCIAAFVAAMLSVVAAGEFVDRKQHRAAGAMCAVAVVFVLAASVLISFGWTPEHP